VADSIRQELETMVTDLTERVKALSEDMASNKTDADKSRKQQNESEEKATELRNQLNEKTLQLAKAVRERDLNEEERNKRREEAKPLRRRANGIRVSFKLRKQKQKTWTNYRLS